MLMVNTKYFREVEGNEGEKGWRVSKGEAI
jgi:hypothetical protein